jgi:hypothetical protein
VALKSSGITPTSTPGDICNRAIHGDGCAAREVQGLNVPLDHPALLYLEPDRDLYAHRLRPSSPGTPLALRHPASVRR